MHPVAVMPRGSGAEGLGRPAPAVHRLRRSVERSREGTLGHRAEDRRHGVGARQQRMRSMPLAVLALLYCVVEEQRRGFGSGQVRHRTASRLAGLRSLLERLQLAPSWRGGCGTAAGSCRGGGPRLVRQLHGR